ncbi:MAG TPA: hypothetical protein VEF76_01565 [Patescibacteria group bacterium]|nr:hypothetical protein [Patescibacteria group bacterium]
MSDAQPETKKPSKLKGALKAAFGKHAPWWVKVLRSTALVLTFFPAVEFGLMPNLPGRELTPGERTTIKAVFNDAVNADKIRVHTSKGMDLLVNPFAPITGNVIYGHTRGNVIIMNGEIKEADYSKAFNDFAREAFLHESVHVWQHQHKPFDTACDFMKLSVSRQGGLEGFYSYTLAPGKDLLDYNIEQQAVIVTDYFLHVQKGEPPEYSANTEKGAQLKALYDGTLKNFKENPKYISAPRPR